MVSTIDRRVSKILLHCKILIYHRHILRIYILYVYLVIYKTLVKGDNLLLISLIFCDSLVDTY